MFKRGRLQGQGSGQGGGEGGGHSGDRAGTPGGGNAAARPTREATGQAAEDRALAHLQAAGLTLVQRNYRVARGPARHGGEIDLVMREADGTLVFVEVRARAQRTQGGAAASVGATKQRRLVHAAQCYLMALPVTPPCRFDVVAIDGTALQWLRAAFDAG